MAGSPRRGVADRYERWVTTPEAGDMLRSVFRSLNRGMVIMWRLGLGPMFGWWPSTAGTILVLCHVGRRTGTHYRAPVNYADVEGQIYCIAGFGEVTDWYRNLMARPVTEVWLPDGRWEMEVEDVGAHPDRVVLMRRVLMASGFAAPLFGLHPRRMSDDEVDAITAAYRLLHLRKLRRLPGSSADLAWLWSIPLAWVVMGWIRSGIRKRSGCERAVRCRRSPPAD